MDEKATKFNDETFKLISGYKQEIVDYLFQPEQFSEYSETSRQYLTKLDTMRLLYIMLKIKAYLTSTIDGIIKTKELKNLRSQLMEKIIQSIYLKAKLQINSPKNYQNLNFNRIRWGDIFQYTLEKYSQLINSAYPIETGYPENMSFDSNSSLVSLVGQVDPNLAGPSGLPTVMPISMDLDISDVSIKTENDKNKIVPPIIESEHFNIKADVKVVYYDDMDFRNLLDQRNFSYPYPLVRLRADFKHRNILGYNQELDLFMGTFVEYNIHQMAEIFKIHYPLNEYLLNNNNVKCIAVNTSILKHYYKIYFSGNVELALSTDTFRYKYEKMTDEPLTTDEWLFFNSYIYGNLNLFKMKINIDYVKTSGRKDLEEDPFYIDMQNILTQHAKEKKYLLRKHKYTNMTCFFPAIFNEAIYFQWAYEGQVGTTMQEIYKLPFMHEYIQKLAEYINGAQLQGMHRSTMLRDYYYWFINDGTMPDHFNNLTPYNFNMSKWEEFSNYVPWIGSTLYSDDEYLFILNT